MVTWTNTKRACLSGLNKREGNQEEERGNYKKKKKKLTR